MQSDNSFVKLLDAVFKRDDLRGVYPEAMNAEVAMLAGWSFAKLCGKEPCIAVGYDARLSSPELSRAVCQGVALAGGRTVKLGMVSSEQLYFACGQYPERFQGGVMVTASHNPAEYNGMKFLHAGGQPVTSDELAKIRQWMTELHDMGATQEVPVCSESCDLSEAFAERMLSLSATPKALPEKPLRILVAAGNGVGAKAFAPIATRLEQEGCEFVWLDEVPDGHFPHGVPNPLLPEYMSRIGTAVRAHGAQLGIGFDGDADRAGFVDEQGAEIIPAQVYALVVQDRLAGWRGSGKPVVMRNLCCSRLIWDLFDGPAEVVDTPVGHGQIKQLMRHPRYRERILFAGEHSGHYFYPEFYSVDSGMLTSLALIRRTQRLQTEGKCLSGVLSEWRKNYCWSGERNFELPSREQVYTALQEVWEQLQRVPGTQRVEIRIDPELGLPRAFPGGTQYEPQAIRFPDLKVVVDHGDSGWWCVVRPSGNEPKLRLNVEAWGKDAQARCDEVTTQIAGWLG
ncbi:MAG: hypothetical protein J5654_00925 [Victivallales bacterium]|nr:hypothetical protein [Victivallales bacterium]